MAGGGIFTGREINHMANYTAGTLSARADLHEAAHADFKRQYVGAPLRDGSPVLGAVRGLEHPRARWIDKFIFGRGKGRKVWE